MLTKEECHSYWKHEVNDVGNTDKQMNINNPILYACKPPTIITFLDNFWTPEISKTDTILELGCNCGVNLNHLKNIGYKHLIGVDINEQAIYAMQTIFPETFKLADLYIDTIEKILQSIPTKSIDVVFSIAVLEHIHPTVIEEVSKNIVRIAKRYIITSECEYEETNERVFKHKYKELFETNKCEEVKYNNNNNISEELGYIGIERNIFVNSFEYKDYITRMFKVN